MVCYAFHQTTLCGRDIEAARSMTLDGDAAAYAVAQAMIETGNRVVEVWRQDTLVWRFEAATQACDPACQNMSISSIGSFERWVPACRLHPLNIALANELVAEAAA
jgi:hypothetical protein